jgi:hypothetical protein
MQKQTPSRSEQKKLGKDKLELIIGMMKGIEDTHRRPVFA